MGPLGQLPADFARQLAEILEPGDEHAAAQVLQAAIRLDDVRLGNFLEMLAERVRSSARPITGAELRAFLRASTRGEKGAP
jgi:hypothetical protein